MKIKLTDWSLCGYHNYVPVLEKSMETGVHLRSVTPVIAAKVPGSVYEPLIDAGIIPDPYLDCNSRMCEWVADRFWIYATEVELSPKKNGRCRLIFEGIDCKCEIRFNNKLVGKSDNMYVPVVCDVTDLAVCGKNSVKVMLFSAPDEMGQIGYTSRVHTQKARFSYKWDFCPRLPGMGIYKPVWIDTSEVYTEEEDFRSDASGSFSYRFRMGGDTDGLNVKIAVSDEKKAVFEATACLNESGEAAVCGTVPSVRPWNCNGEGEAYLYTLERSYYRKGKLLFKESRRVGFKTLEVAQNDGAYANSPPYKFVLNGREVWMKGVNITPLDMLYGRITSERYVQLVADMKEMNVNLVRVWGGGFIESEEFYDLCDKSGILVWQDFIQSSSGIDNHPSKDKKYIDKFLATVAEAVSVKRNHVCTAVFCGGNEIAVGASRTPIDEKDPLTAAVGSYVRAHSDVHFVPSTPAGASFSPDLDRPEVNHDVHAPWLYLGTEEQYRFGNRLRCLFHSEFGCNGMAERESMEKFLSAENVGAFSYEDNYVWRHHGELWDTYKRDSGIFADMQTLEDMIEASQFIQAEGLRYIVESDRRRAFFNGGVMIWSFNEPFPNVSNLCLIDYYGKRKAAYFAVKRAFSKSYASVVYEKLVWRKGEICTMTPYVICGDSGAYTLNLEVACGGRALQSHRFRGRAEANRAIMLDALEVAVPNGEALELRFCLLSASGEFTNRILLLIADENGKAKLGEVKRHNASLRQDKL